MYQNLNLVNEINVNLQFIITGQSSTYLVQFRNLGNFCTIKTIVKIYLSDKAMFKVDGVKREASRFATDSQRTRTARPFTLIAA